MTKLYVLTIIITGITSGSGDVEVPKRLFPREDCEWYGNALATEYQKAMDRHGYGHRLTFSYRCDLAK